MFLLINNYQSEETMPYIVSAENLQVMMLQCKPQKTLPKMQW